MLTSSAERPLIICTVRYSSNLGDGVIGDCLEYIVRLASPARQILHLDMAGRTSFQEPQSATRTDFAKQAFFRCPSLLRPLLTRLAWPLLFRPKIERAWQATRPPEPFDLVFGGGQILSDLALNFPLKFDHVVRLASADGARVAVNAVGVSSRWSRPGNRLFGTALTSPALRSFSVRDEQSRRNLEKHVPTLNGHVVTTVDPAVVASDVYSLSARPKRPGPWNVGLGLSDPTELAAYAKHPDAFGEERMITYWSEIITRLSALGHHPVLFTNGSDEDEAFVDRIIARLPDTNAPVRRLRQATTPRALVDHFREFDALISHRLHANIIAFSAGIPAVALVWDEKVSAFAVVAGREQWTLPAGAGAQESVSLILDAARAGVEPGRREALKTRAIADVRRLLVALESDAA